jgi:BirA family biotin operon repressor/biotin-[acetyl-CoA-carboxylase] ligase
VISQLNADSIREPITGLPRAQLDFLEVFSEIESTNTYLLKQPAPPPGRFRVALAEHQTAGRGRLDKRWHSPGSSGLCLSMSYTFASTPDSLPALTLAIGVGAVQALEKLGALGIGLKWPNDLIFRDGKLGGILTEVRSAARDEPTVVVGIGINYDLGGIAGSADIATSVGHVSALADCMRGMPSRSTASTALIEGLFNTLAEFEADGFGRFANDWEKYDWLRGQTVVINRGNDRIAGVCQGIDSDGALVLRTESGRQRVLSGSVDFSEQMIGRSSGLSGRHT